ncbi:PfkB family carbohydrate kinase [Actinomadura viridis]|uniref:Sugar/nucleoside kinase (Ribokinase family) n=1 Tax=Actinomadura viridis TaxID=58110 RepID=A0A931DMA2_9ACTN|nr:PfkB family carbohydrate kinase [Actinomadura viridis]MBG6093809.1 sugar/nucleoside kinase (ribokinase family) [Actinomadura viridis]
MTVLVVGDVIDDIVVRPLRPTAPDTDTPSAITAGPGGSGANQAAWLGALGARVRFAGRVGAADAAAHTAALAAAGVDARLAADPGAPTGRIVVLARGGRRDMYTDRGANLNLSAADLPDDLLDGVTLLHVSGYSLFQPGVRAAAGDLMRRARERGAATSVDPASAAFLADAGPEAFRAWARGARLIFPNLDEGRLLTGAREPSAVAAALLDDHPVVALKLGAEGALVAARDGTRLALPSAPAEVVDPTGAGDAFCAGFLAGWAAGRPLEDCARGAVAAAGRAVAAVGARPRKES